MEPQFQFPTEGWRHDGSTTYGKADLYQDIPHVVVNIFSESKKTIAEETHRFLKSNGVSTATIEEITHVDGKPYYYVFAEREEFLACRERLFPNIQVSRPGAQS